MINCNNPKYEPDKWDLSNELHEINNTMNNDKNNDFILKGFFVKNIYLVYRL